MRTSGIRRGAIVGVRLLGLLLLGAGGLLPIARAQTDGSAKLEVTLLDYNGSGAKHYTVVWVTTESGTFIKSLRKQGPTSWTDKDWTSHCQTWTTARNGSTVLDGYTSATATSYAGTNSPVICTWNCRDASNKLMADGKYKFWVQYAENSGQGPVTTGGLLWTKGPAPAAPTYANQGANFANMRVTWTPSTPTPEAPLITSVPLPATGTVGVPYSFTCTAKGTDPITFTAAGLPTGLAISATGAVTGTPLIAGTYPGTITAANGTLPNATQAFSVLVGVVPANIGAIRREGDSFVLSGTGPANGTYAVLIETNLTQSAALRTPIATNRFDSAGAFRFTNAIESGTSQRFYQLRVP